MSTHPLISVVTPSFNQGQFIENTISSVLMQYYERVQYIIMDGGSTDSTLDILRRYQSSAEIVSERDDGQVDAIRKGFAKAHGEILTWLNSDDVYIYKDTLTRVANLFRRNPDVAVISGSTVLLDSNNGFLQAFRAFPRFRIRQLMLYDFIKQPATFFRATVLSNYNLDATLDCAFDYDFWLRLSTTYKFLMVPDVLAGIRRHTDMKTIRLSEKMAKESRAILDRYRPQIQVKPHDRLIAPLLRGMNKIAGLSILSHVYHSDTDAYATPLRKTGYMRACLRQLINHKGIVL